MSKAQFTAFSVSWSLCIFVEIKGYFSPENGVSVIFVVLSFLCGAVAK